MSRWFPFVIVVLGLLSAPASAAPRLGVLLIFDQMRAADVERHAPFFGPQGFGGLPGRGAHYDAMYPYAVTETGPGHATLATGAAPPVHGIAANRWWIDGVRTYCVADESSKVIGSKDAHLGPAHLRAPTLGDALKAATSGRAHVVTLSHKDRAAILTGGTAADLALWYEADQTAFTTGTHYRDALPPWVTTFNEALPGRLASARWSALKTPAALQGRLPEDDQAGEQRKIGGRVFPHDLAELKPKRRAKDYRGTPTAMGDLFRLARLAIENEGLGDDDVPDLLVISVSSLDYAGHWFGPDSLEVLDLLRRTDKEVRDFTAFLDERLGRQGWSLAMSADHGSPPLVERARAAGVRAMRIPAKPLFRDVRAELARVAPGKDRLAGAQPPHIFLDLSGLKPDVARRATAAAAARFAREPGIALAVPTDQLRASADPFMRELELSTAKGRSGHILVRVEPFALIDFSGDQTGADHGTPYAYDRQVPLILVGPGVRRGRYGVRADPRDVAPTLAFLLGVTSPAAAQGTVLSAVGQR